MAKDLIELIKASGGAGQSGQTFANNVTGAGTGARMTDYLLPDGSASDNWDPAADTQTTYASGATFNPYVSFNYQYGGQGSRFYNIRRNGTTPWTNNTGSNVTLNSVTWDDNYGTATLNMTINGDYDTNTSQTLNSFYFDFSDTQYQNGIHNPPDSAGYSVELWVAVYGASNPAGSSVITPSFTYDPDTASFNPNQTFTWSGVRVYKRAYPSWTTMYEWQTHNTSVDGGSPGSWDSSTLVSSTFTSYVDTTYDVKVRYRLKASYNNGTSGAWQYGGQISWSDNRPDF